MARKQKKYHYIYKTTCNVTGKYYIGMHSTDNLEDGYMGSGKRLWFSLNYHGKENHTKEILEFCEGREELKEREAEIVNEQLLNEDLCMNLMTGGQGGFSGEEHMMKFVRAGGEAFTKKLEEDEEFREKRRIHCSNNMKKNIREGKIKPYDWTGRKHTDKAKVNMSKAKSGKGLGKNNSQYGTCWVTKDGNNKKIKKEEFNTFISQGWEKGRKMK